MKLLLFYFVVAFSFQEIPLKPKEEFEVKLDYKFKQRPLNDSQNNSVHFDETKAEKERRTSSDVLPFLTLKIHLLKLPSGETRARIDNNKPASINIKKISEKTVISLVMGFTADVKDRIAPHHYEIFLLSSEKEEVNKIVIDVDEDGIFLVNGEKRGKF